MHYSVLGAVVLVVAAAVCAGCLQNPAPAANPVPTPTGDTPPAATTTLPRASFSLGYHYLQDQYKFNSPTDVYTEKFIVDSPSWAIKFDVSPKSENLSACWFVLNVTDVNRGGEPQSFGYGGNFPYEKDQLIPMYNTGSYRLDLSGNLVTVAVTAAKRNP